MHLKDRYVIAWSVLGWTMAAPFVMRRGPVRAFETWRRERPPVARFGSEDLIAIADAILLCRVAGRLLFRTRCLKRTLVLWRLLRAHGHDPHALIGLDREGRGLAGHAWLELNGQRLKDPVFTPPRDFVPFLSIGDHTLALTGPRDAIVDRPRSAAVSTLPVS